MGKIFLGPKNVSTQTVKPTLSLILKPPAQVVLVFQMDKCCKFQSDKYPLVINWLDKSLCKIPDL